MPRSLALVFSFLVIPLFAAAQETPAPQKETHTQQRVRPKIGVALEGGGALGLAHVGVLQWFEEHHIPVDYVAGTSMGGLVGGFYSTGMSPTDMRKMIEGIDWDQVLRDQTPYQDLSFLRKEDQRLYPNSLLFGLRKGVYLPAGLNSGHQIGLLIDRETAPYFGLHSFDELPIPFRAVATDLVSAKEFIFQDGSLAEALRATMSVPGIFTPVNDGRHVYVDGGLVNNLPTDVVRQMGAEIVIAAHLEVAPVDAKSIQTLVDVLEQSVRSVISNSEVRGLANSDAVVTVPLGNFSLRDFTKYEPLMQAGYEAAKGKSKLLDTFALDDTEWNEYVSQREARKRTVIPVPAFIEVRGTNPAAQKAITRYLRPFVGKPLEPEKLAPALTRLTGLGRYDTLGYRIVDRDGQQGLLISVAEKDFGPPTLQPGFEIDGSEAGDIEFTLATRLRILDLAGFRSDWRTDFLFGSTYGVASELYRPFSAASRWFFAPRADASDATFQIYAKNDPLAYYRFYRENAGADLGYGFSRFSEVRFGYSVGSLSTKLRLGSQEIPSVSGRVGASRMRYVLDHTDDPVIPRRGFRVESNFRWFDTSPGTTEAFPVLDMRFEYFQPVSRVASFFLTGDGGSAFGFRNTGLPQFFLGGPNRLGAYGINELFGDQYYLFRGGYLHELAALPPFIGKRVYFVGAYEAGKVYGAANESRFPNDFAAGVLAETSLGPFFVGGSVGDNSHHKWYFQLGRVF